MTLPPAGYVYRRDESAAEDRNVKADNFDNDEVLVDRRDEITHLPASFVYIAKVPKESTDDSGSGASNLVPSSQDDKTSGVKQGQPWVTVPEPKTIGVPKFTLPVEKPGSMIRRLVDAGRGLGADLIIHKPADGIRRRDDKPRDGKDPHNTKQTSPGLNPHTLEPEKSEVEQLFQQSKSADQADRTEAKLTVMRLAQDLYRRGGHEPVSPGGGRFREPVDAQHISDRKAPGGDDMGPVNMAKLTTLYPMDGVYRRSQNVKSTGQDVESTSQTGSEDVTAVKGLIAAFNDEDQLKATKRDSEHVESLSQNMESLGQIIDGQNHVEDTAAVEHSFNAPTALNSVRQLEPSKRSILEPDYLKHRPGPGRILPMLSERDPSGRTIFNEIKDKLDKLKPTPGGDSSSGGSGKGGDSASGGDTSNSGSGNADSKAGVKRRSLPGELDTESEARSKDNEIDQPDVLPHKGEVPGSPKHRVVDDMKAVYRRSARSIDGALPDFPTPSAHERAGSVFRRSVDVEALESVSKPVSRVESAPESAPLPIPIDIENINPPKYRVIAPADSVFRSHGAVKRSTLAADDSTLSDSEDLPRHISDEPKSHISVPQRRESRIEADEDVKKQRNKAHLLPPTPNTNISGPLPIAHGPTADLHRRDGLSHSSEEEGQQDGDLSKRCYGQFPTQFPTQELCELTSAPYVYRVKEGGQEEDEGRRKGEKDKQKQKEKEEKKEKEKKEKDNQRRDSIALPDTNGRINKIEPSFPSPPSRIDVRKRCYTHNSDAQYCQLRTAPEVYWEGRKGDIRRRDDANNALLGGDVNGDVEGEAGVGRGEHVEVKEKKVKGDDKKFKEEERKKVNKDETKGDSA